LLICASSGLSGNVCLPPKHAILVANKKGDPRLANQP